MIGEVFEKLIMKLGKKMGNQNRKMALAVDNCLAHPNVFSKLSNANLLFLPLYSTSKLQQVNQGLIKNLKLHYTKYILQ